MPVADSHVGKHGQDVEALSDLWCKGKNSQDKNRKTKTVVAHVGEDHENDVRS